MGVRLKSIDAILNIVRTEFLLLVSSWKINKYQFIILLCVYFVKSSSNGKHLIEFKLHVKWLKWLDRLKRWVHRVWFVAANLLPNLLPNLLTNLTWCLVCYITFYLLATSFSTYLAAYLHLPYLLSSCYLYFFCLLPNFVPTWLSTCYPHTTSLTTYRVFV